MIKKYKTDINNNIYLNEEVVDKVKGNSKNIITVNPNDQITNFLGFGSAITESSGFNYQELSDKNKENFINDYFTSRGLNLSFARISIGSNDFSLSAFSYAKKRDLSDYNISRDYHYVIPFLQDILSKKKISLIASPWSPPRMYKRIPILKYGFKLAKKHYDNYSNYLVRYLKEYEKIGIEIDYLTMQNEPMARQSWESCRFKVNEQKDFIYHYLLNKLENTKLLLWDHNKDNLFNNINEIYEENDKIAGFAFHYYTGAYFNEVEKLRNKYPDKLLINTEMCCSYLPYDEKKWLSSAEYYIYDIIGDMNSGVNAYLDWNILLDEKGGPSHIKNPVKSPSIRVNDYYIKSPIYYYLFHISHFIDKKNTVVKTTTNTKLQVVSIKTNKKLIIIVMNRTNDDIEYNLMIDKQKIFDKIEKHSIITYEII